MPADLIPAAAAAASQAGNSTADASQGPASGVSGPDQDLGEPQANTVPMFSPDWRLGDIPGERAVEASKAGFKLGIPMLSPDGSAGVIPWDRVPEAMKAGFKQSYSVNPAMKNQVTKMTRLLGGGDLGEVSPGAEAAGEVAQPALSLAKSFAQKVVGHLKEMLGMGEEAGAGGAEAAAAVEAPENAGDEVADEDYEVPDDERQAGHEIEPQVENTPRGSDLTKTGKKAAEDSFLKKLGKTKEDIAAANAKGQMAYQKHLTRQAVKGAEFGPRGGVTPELMGTAKQAARAAYLKHLKITEFELEEAKSAARQGYMDHVNQGMGTLKDALKKNLQSK